MENSDLLILLTILLGIGGAAWIISEILRFRAILRHLKKENNQK